MSSRPVLHLDPSPTERRWDGVAIVGLGVAALLAAYALAVFEGPVPTHFDAAGRPDAYGSKGILLVLLIPAVTTGALLVGLRGSPHTFNFPVPITEENAPRQYRNAREMLAAMGAGIAWTLAALVAAITGTAAGWFTVPGPVLLVGLLALTISPLAWYVGKALADR